MINQIHQGHVLDVLKSFPDECVDVCITSPPYWSLRSYGTEPQIWDTQPECEHEWGDELPPRGKSNWSTFDDYNTDGNPRLGKGKKGDEQKNISGQFCLNCNAWKGELGLEPTFQLYLKHLIDVFREIKRVVKRTGSIWVNLGDSYSSKGNLDSRWADDGNLSKSYHGRGRTTDIPSKSLCGIPERFAIAMTDELELIRRNTIIWYKPNCMPSSANDRFTVDFEPFYFFTKSQKYYFERQFELHESTPFFKVVGAKGSQFQQSQGDPNGYHAYGVLGRNKRTVWRIPTQPSSIEHYAQFPEDLVITPILSCCPEFICVKCNKAREKIIKLDYQSTHPGSIETNNKYYQDNNFDTRKHGKAIISEIQFQGYTDCGCNAEFRPGVVLDPFCGTGTTLQVAEMLGRSWVGIDLKPQYVKIAGRTMGTDNDVSELPLFGDLEWK